MKRNKTVMPLPLQALSKPLAFGVLGLCASVLMTGEAMAWGSAKSKMYHQKDTQQTSSDIDCDKHNNRMSSYCLAQAPKEQKKDQRAQLLMASAVKHAAQNGDQIIKNGDQMLKDKAISKAKKVGNDHLNQAARDLGIFKQININVNPTSKASTIYALDGVLDLKTFEKDADGDPLSVLFGQIRAAGTVFPNENEATFNLGLGYRTIVNENSLYGINGFLDHRILKDVSSGFTRFGLGFEYFWQNLEFRNNWYIPITGEKDVNGYTYRIVPGADIEVGYRLPQMPEVATYLKAFYWDYKHRDDNVGVQAAVNYQVNPHINSELFVSNEDRTASKVTQDGDNIWRVGLNVNYSINPVTDLGAGFSKEQLQAQLYKPVRRNYNVLIEQRVKASVTISRGD